MKNKAFTLIEVLIVVLIIAILAAIAVPKYQLAVDRADFRKYQSMAHSLETAYDEYYLANGVATDDFANLSITLPSDFIKTYSLHNITCYSNATMFCCMSDSSASHSSKIFCGKNDLSVIYEKVYFAFNYTQAERRGRCYAERKNGVENARAKRLCSSLGTKDATGSAWTPQGTNNSYQKYFLN